MRTYLVAVVAHNQDDLQKFLLASPHGPGNDGTIDCWWIAEDDREDGSDCDSAIFVPRGGQEDVSSVVSNWIEHHTEEWDEEGYPFAATDVGGAFYLAPEQREAAARHDALFRAPLLEEREAGTFYVGPLEPAKHYIRDAYTDVREGLRENGSYLVGEYFAADDDEPHSWGCSESGDAEEAWRYFLGTDFGPIDEGYDEPHLRRLLFRHSALIKENQ
jgi:hypothetical protein